LLRLYTQAQYAFSLLSACLSHIQSVRWRACAAERTVRHSAGRQEVHCSIVARLSSSRPSDSRLD